MKYTDSGAVISECSQYRYKLWRTWDESKPKVMFLMCNPSTADHTKDDPTIRRCVSFAESWGYGGIMVGNLFAFRATKPEILLMADDPVGSDNDFWLTEMNTQCDKIICAWGNSKHVGKLSYHRPLEGMAFRLFYLELANDGTPKHPLYLKKDLQPKLLV